MVIYSVRVLSKCWVYAELSKMQMDIRVKWGSDNTM